ncbi:acetylglutamate kinase [Haliscomenobacter hydrossis]|uniref:Acetylglutamate kinase n=1 Tax=Haliscomenobacter hydrossis (strain ATCC 27775 / DSM 1100 / LMG 10767 / O) TaxID=760192 RepID=F4KPH3_HALH1|nr:acetylglutamate kinase [Haliscomenobacter hydrossis]AEE49927.1 acetylglutamate kinase [Haliscomenobacter hydrossis DSM 1100]
MTLHILKVGGKVIDDLALLQPILESFLQKEGKKIIVHGGGKKASELSEKLGIAVQMVNGRRITDAASLEVATMVYAGLFNKQIVALLQSLGGNALGLSGADGNVILAHRRPVKEIDYGFVGDLDQVNAQAIHRLLNADFTPVFCAITHDGQGQLLNTNADTIASSLATAMSTLYEVKLYLCLDKNGVLSNPEDDASVIPSMNAADYERFKAEGIVYAGMLPKLDNAFDALRQGVKEVIICGPESVCYGGGTVIYQD